MLAQTVTCPHCNAVYTLPASLAEAIVAKCPQCGRSPTPESNPTHTFLNRVEATHAASEVPIHRAPDVSSSAVSMGGSGGASGKYSFLSPPQQADELGRLGTYRILGLLGAGGMGIVFRAEDPALRRQIALKVMLPSFASDPKSKARFLREARAQAAIKHDHIIDIYQIGEEREIPFIAMPLLKGQTLADALKTNPDVPIGEAIRIAREMAEGLSAAHEENLIHRDIKPANIWLESRHRRVKILDFGLARTETGADEPEGTDMVTHQGSVVGTPSHMSPEQAQGEAVDVRTDLFSMGVVLYQMLTAQQPFSAKNLAATFLAVITKTPARPISLNPHVPPALDLLTMRLLAKDREDRPPTATAVADALTLIEVDLNLTATVPSVSTEAVVADPWMSVAKTDPDTVLPGSSKLHTAVPKTATVTDPASPPKRRRSLLPIAVLLVFGAVAAAAVGYVVVNKKEKLREETVEPGNPVAKKITDPEPKKIDPPIPEIKKPDTQPKKPDPEPKKVETDPKPVTPETKKTPEKKMPDAEPKPPEMVIEAPPPVPVFDSRTAAEWVINLGGTVQINDQGVNIKTAAELPREPFRLTYVWLRNAKLDGPALAIFKDCRSLTYLNLSNTPISDPDLVYFKDCKALAAINLSGTQLTDAGLAYFKDCKNLLALSLGDTEVTDTGLNYFRDSKGLTYLNLNNTKVTDAGVAYFKDCKGFTYINLSKTKITDAALNHIKDCKSLASFMLSGTKVTGPRVLEFAKTNPQCEVTWDGGVYKPKKPKTD